MRLEEIKGRFMEYEYNFNFDSKDIKFLIEQAERAQELEKELQGMHEIYDIRLDKYEKLEQQNKRYRESLLKIDDYDIEVGDMRDDLQHKLLQIKHIKDEALESELE